MGLSGMAISHKVGVRRYLPISSIADISMDWIFPSRKSSVARVERVAVVSEPPNCQQTQK